MIGISCTFKLGTTYIGIENVEKAIKQTQTKGIISLIMDIATFFVPTVDVVLAILAFYFGYTVRRAILSLFEIYT